VTRRIVLTTAAVLLAAWPAAAQQQQKEQDPLAPVPGGITADQVGTRALAASYQVEAGTELANAASARADQAFGAFIPRVTMTGRYSRLSNFTPEPLIDTPGVQAVLTRAPEGTLNPAPTQAVSPTIPVIVNQYVAQATLTIPVSDYFLRISKAYTAATNADDAARNDLVATKAKALADGKIAYYNWVRARGATVVAQQTLAVARAHLHDTEVGGGAGATAKADILRARTAVAQGELLVERAKNGASIAERQLRLAIHASPDEKLEPGESLDAALPPPRDMRLLVSEAHGLRPEIKSIDSNAEAARSQASAARASFAPSLVAFGDVTYANPNPRRFPPKDEWFPTWAIGAALTWTPTDIPSAAAAAADYEARANALDAPKKAVRDGIELEVAQAYNSALEADVATGTTTRELDSATEGYRVARELYNAGRGTSTLLSDAESVLAQARFDRLNARVDARIARVRLDHATGKDTRAVR
jgi:outer membrane protein TolC